MSHIWSRFWTTTNMDRLPSLARRTPNPCIYKCSYILYIDDNNNMRLCVQHTPHNCVFIIWVVTMVLIMRSESMENLHHGHRRNSWIFMRFSCFKIHFILINVYIYIHFQCGIDNNEVNVFQNNNINNKTYIQYSYIYEI